MPVSADVDEADFLKAGDTIVLDGDPWEVRAAEHHGEGTPGVFYVEWVVLDLRNLLSSAQKSVRLPLGSEVLRARLEEKTMLFLYADPKSLYFMDALTLEQLGVAAEQLPHLVAALHEGELVEARAFEGRPLPHTVRRRSQAT